MIDSTLFGVDIPAGTYAAGDVITLQNIAGPSVVRSGRGAAHLKMINSGLVGQHSGSSTTWKIKIKNSDWIDPVINFSGNMAANTALDVRSGCNNFGHDCELTPNSAWEVVAECMIGGTTTVANSIYTLIDVDYPQVASIVDPATLKGIPTGIEFSQAGVAANAAGTLTSSAWSLQNVDIFKAGYQYALEKMEILTPQAGVAGFVSIGNAAGQAGLTRIIPVVSALEAIKQTIDYASTLVKGPMDIKSLLFNQTAATATTVTLNLVLDYVKRKV